MKRVGLVLAVGFACAAYAAAQAQTSAPSTQSSAKSDNAITVVGCLQHAEGSSTGATGTAGSTTPGSPASRMPAGSGNASFILTNASPAGASPSSAPSSAAGSPAGTSGTKGTTYVLEGSSSDLSADNTGKRVEVKGTLAMSSSSAAGSPAGAPGGSASTASGPHLNVTSVRVIGSDCAAK
jgi:hypothetical protein